MIDGGTGKRCEKGKSCGATCIYRRKICRKGLAKSVSEGLSAASELPGKKLSRLETTEEFEKKIKDTEREYTPEIARMHEALDNLLESEGSEKLNRLYKELGKGDVEAGEDIAGKAWVGIKVFTGDYHDEIRKAQMGISPNPADAEKFLKLANNVEKLINSSVVERPLVEKFRGVKVDPNTLQGMIESAKAGGRFDGRALSSWSTSLDMARHYSGKETSDPNKSERVIFRAMNVKGVPLDSLTSSPGEFEVLTSGSASYRYLGYARIRGADGFIYHVLDVSES